MVNQIQRIKPHTGFVVSLAADFSAFSEQNFTNLYQPIIGANAFALFLRYKQMLRRTQCFQSEWAILNY